MAAVSDIKAQVGKWREQLLDLTKRNRLINCRIGRSGALSIDHPPPEDVWRQVVADGSPLIFPRKTDLLGLVRREEEEDASIFDAEGPDTCRTAGGGGLQERVISIEECLSSPRLRANHALTQLADKALNGKLTRLSLAAKTSISEQGVNNLFLAFGLLRWFESQDSTTPILSPLLLVPARLQRQNSDSDWRLSLLEEEVNPNHSLNELLTKNFTLRLPEIDEEREIDDPQLLSDYLGAVQAAVAQQRRWGVESRCLLGAFGFQKVAMWQDLGRNEKHIGEHSVCRAIAGDGDALRQSDRLFDLRELDDATTPTSTHHILDCE